MLRARQHIQLAAVLLPLEMKFREMRARPNKPVMVSASIAVAQAHGGCGVDAIKQRPRFLGRQDRKRSITSLRRIGDDMLFLPARPASRRQRNTRLVAAPCLRATEETDAASVSATICFLSAADHFRHVSATTAMLFSWLYPDIGTA